MSGTVPLGKEPTVGIFAAITSMADRYNRSTSEEAEAYLALVRQGVLPLPSTR